MFWINNVTRVNVYNLSLTLLVWCSSEHSLFVWLGDGPRQHLLAVWSAVYQQPSTHCECQPERSVQQVSRLLQEHCMGWTHEASVPRGYLPNVLSAFVVCILIRKITCARTRTASIEAAGPWKISREMTVSWASDNRLVSHHWQVYQLTRHTCSHSSHI